MTETDTIQGHAAWREALDAHGAEHGAHLRLGGDHGALFTEDGETLLVTFERAGAIRDHCQGALPYGLEIAGREGFSQLCLYSETDGFFRDPEVIAYFDRLVDEGFFDEFDRVVFYGAGPCGYAAAAYSVTAPGATVVLLQPLATLDPARTEWDDRFPAMRRTDFSSRYGYAPEMLEAAAEVFLLYDPGAARDAMHASLFAADHIHRLRLRGLGPAFEHHLAQIGLLPQMLRKAGRGRLAVPEVFGLYRARHRHPPYLRKLVVRCEAAGRPWRAGIAARAALRHHDGPRFRNALAAAEKALSQEGRALPEPRIGKEAAE